MNHSSTMTPQQSTFFLQYHCLCVYCVSTQQYNMGSLKNSAIFIFLVVILISNVYCNDILNRIEAVEQENKGLAKRVKILEGKNKLLQDENAHISSKLESVIIELNETKEILTKTNNV